ncbi:uncharacterized protein ACIBXB_020903 isoform 1-T1 [Morphnus guianensis]
MVTRRARGSDAARTPAGGGARRFFPPPLPPFFFLFLSPFLPVPAIPVPPPSPPPPRPVPPSVRRLRRPARAARAGPGPARPGVVVAAAAAAPRRRARPGPYRYKCKRVFQGWGPDIIHLCVLPRDPQRNCPQKFTALCLDQTFCKQGVRGFLLGFTAAPKIKREQQHHCFGDLQHA